MVKRRSGVGGVLVALGLVASMTVLVGCIPTRSGPDPEGLFSEGAALGLARAVQAGDTDEIGALISAGTDVEITGDHGTTMLQWAVMTSKHDSLVALLAAGADPDITGHDGNGPIHEAAFHSDPAYLVSLLEAGADPDLRGEVTGSTALKNALRNNVDEPFYLLLEAGADVNIVDKNGDGPIHTAARTNKGAALLALLEAGADPAAVSGRATFQNYYWGYNPDILNDRSRAERARIIEWLEAHDVPLDPRAEQFRADG